MEKKDMNSSVFIENTPSIKDLKSCAFFWENIYVYESFLENFIAINPPNEALYESSKMLLERDVIKIVMTEGETLQANLCDKIYTRMDDDIRQFLYENADEISVTVDLNETTKSFVEEAAEKEYQDEDLCKLMDSMHYELVKSKVIEDREESQHIIEILEVSKGYTIEAQKFNTETIDELTKLEYSQYESRDPRMRYGFDWLNESLLIKNSVSSSILTSQYQLPYYHYKFDNFENMNADKYIEAINASMPIIKRDTIDDFTLEEILRIRKNAKWKNAMNRLAEICANVKYETNTDEYKKEINSELIDEYSDSLDEYIVTGGKLAKDMLKDGVLTGIGFVPIVGATVSAVGGQVDCVRNYLKERKKQQNLAFFLNDIRKGRY